MGNYFGTGGNHNYDPIAAADAAHSAHVGGPAPKKGSSPIDQYEQSRKSSSPKPYGGVISKQSYDASVEQEDNSQRRQAALAPGRAGEAYAMQHAGESPAPLAQQREDQARMTNENLYSMGQAGNKYAAAKVQDTDELLAQQRGMPSGTEFQDNGIDIIPSSNNMAPGTKKDKK